MAQDTLPLDTQVASAEAPTQNPSDVLPGVPKENSPTQPAAQTPVEPPQPAPAPASADVPTPPPRPADLAGGSQPSPATTPAAPPSEAVPAPAERPRDLASYVASKTTVFVPDSHVNIQGLSPRLNTTLTEISKAAGAAGVPEVRMTSGYRSPEYNANVGGAKSSQHMGGDAVDFDLKGLAEDQRKAFVKTILDNPGVGGIGFYANGTIHVDVRKGSKAAWGGDRTRATLTRDAPSWALPMVEQWQSMGPTSSGGVSMGDGLGAYRGWNPPTEIRSHIQDAATKLGLPVELGIKIAGVESGFNPSIKSTTSSATGLFQMLTKDAPDKKSTWTAMKEKYGAQLGVPADASPSDPKWNALLGMAYIKENRDALKGVLGRDPTDVETYMGHFLGQSGATNFLTAMKADPNKAAVSAVSIRVADANRAIFFDKEGGARSFKQVQDLFQAKLDNASGASGIAGMSNGRPTLADVRPGFLGMSSEWSAPLAQAERQSRGVEQMGFFRAVGEHFMEQPTAKLLMWQREKSYAPDPTYQPDLKALTQGLDERYFSRFANAMNAEHAQAIRDKALKEQDTMASLADMGMVKNMAAGLIAAGADPINLTVGIGSGHLAAAITRGALLGTTAHRVLSGGFGAAGNLGTDYAMSRINGEELDARQAVYGAAIGFGMGAAFGNFGKNTNEQVARLQAVERIKQSVLNPEAPAAAELKAATVGGAPDGPLAAGIVADDYAKASFAGVRWSSGGQLAGSNNPVARVVGAALGIDMVGRPGANVLQKSADQISFQLETQMMGRWRSVGINQYMEWAKEQGFSAAQVHTTTPGWKQFNRMVADAVEADDMSAFPKQVVNAAKAQREIYADMAKRLQNPGILHGVEQVRDAEGNVTAGYRSVKGADNLQPDAQYLPRLMSPSRISEAINTHGEEAVVRTYAGAILDRNPEMAPELAQRMAKGILKDRLDFTKGDLGLLSDVASARDPQTVRALLKDIVPNLSEEDARTLTSIFGSSNPDAGKTANLQRRMHLNINFVDEQTGFKIKDIYERDADAIMAHYLRKNSGRIGLSGTRIYSEADGRVLVNGITSDGEWETVKRQVGAAAQEEVSAGRMTEAQYKKDMENMDFIYRRLVGKPSKADLQSGEMADWTRVIQSLNFTRLMGNLGINTLMDFGRVMAMDPIGSITHMSAMRRIVDMDGRSILRHGIDREAEAIHGLSGGARMSSFRAWNAEEAGNMRAFERGKLVDKVQNIADMGVHAVSEVSGANYIQANLRTLVTKLVAQRFADITASVARGELSKMDLNMIRFTGLNDDMFKRVVKQVQQHFTMEDGSLFKRKVTAMNMEKWDDLEARSAFEFALFRYSRNVVQEGDYGSMSRWMSNPMVRLVAQFRSYSLTAYENQLLHAAANPDGRQAAMFMWSTLSSALVYSALTNVQALGRSDADEFLRKRGFGPNGDPAVLAYGIFQRAGYASLAPNILGTALLATPWAGALDGTQTNQRPADLLFGNPTFGLVDSAAGLSKDISKRVLQGEQFSQKSFRLFTGLMPLGNHIGSQLLTNQLTSGLPAK